MGRCGKDAAMFDAFNLPRGYCETKDEEDDLKTEMNKKFTAGSPLSANQAVFPELKDSRC